MAFSFGAVLPVDGDKGGRRSAHVMTVNVEDQFTKEGGTSDVKGGTEGGG